MRCSLVVRAFNEEQHIGRLLEGVRHQTVPDVEVILVDSGSTDATAAIAGHYGVTVMYIPPAEFTFGRSLNLGLADAADVLLSAWVWKCSKSPFRARSSRFGIMSDL